MLGVLFNHQTSLIVELVKLRFNAQLKGEIAFDFAGKKMAAVADKAVVRFPPEIGIQPGGYLQDAAVQRPCRRFIAPLALLSLPYSITVQWQTE